MSLHDTRRTGRAVGACSECQRRKQKCDRTWPCNHCQSRNTAHLCQSRKGASKPSLVGLSEEESRNRETQSPKKRKHIGMENITSEKESVTQVEESNVTRILNDLGYVKSDIFRSIDNVAIIKHTSNIQLPEEILKALRTVPARPYTDELVQNFFEHVNYHYNILHQTSFLYEYTEWWSQKRQLSSPGIPTIVFTCLVLRVCANSIQFLPQTLLQKLESDLGESADGLSIHYQNSAQILSNYLSPGEGGLKQVQQLFLGATWLKAEAEFVKAWHAVGAAVREGQEIGIHKDDPTTNLSDFEREVRKRLWVGLYTWDRFMSALFNRPSLIASTEPISLPSPRLDQPSTHPDIPSPFVAKMLEFGLASQLSLLLSSAAPDQKTILQYVEGWMAGLPSVFRVQNPDISWDLQYPRLVFQRLQLHCSGYMTLLLLLQPSLLPPSSSTTTQHPITAQQTQAQNQAYAISTALSLMSASHQFFNISYPSKIKYFMVAFSPFNTGALLCSVLANDKERTLERRSEILRAVGTSLWIAGRLKGLTKMGDATFRVLEMLVSRLELGGEEGIVLEFVAGGGEEGGRSGESSVCDGEVFVGGRELGGSGQVSAGWNDALYNGGEFGDGFNNELELGVLDGVWDWESVLFDPFRGI